MPTIPRLNIKGDKNDPMTLNRWADTVQTAFTELKSQAAVANTSGTNANATATKVGNTTVLKNPAGTIISQPILGGPTTTPTVDNITDGTTFGRVKQTGLNGSGVVTQLGDTTGDFLFFTGLGTGTVYNSSGNPVAQATKRNVTTVLFSQTNGATANDGEIVFFNAGSGTPFLQDINGNAFPSFGNIPGIILQSQNPPSGLETLYATSVNLTSFKIVSKGSGSITNYGITVNDGGGIITPTGGSSTSLDISTDAYNTAASTAGGTTTQVQLTASIVTILSETSGRPNFGGIYNFVAQVWSGNMGVLLASGAFGITVRSTGLTYNLGVTLSGLSIAASTAFTCRIYQVSNTDTGAGSSSSATFTAGYTSAASINGVDFIATIQEPWS